MRLLLHVIIAAMVGSATSLVAAERHEVQFNRDIRPILSNVCFRCHGPDPGSRATDLRLDVEAIAKSKLGNKWAILPGDPDASELYRRVSSVQADEKMPPPDSGHELSAEQVRTLRTWIEQGASWQNHWSLQPPARPSVPAIVGANWARNPIDHYIGQGLEKASLRPTAEAAKETLLRRVSLDLIGIPPTIAELDEFLADKSPDAYEKAVDRLLSSPRYGENMAQPWLDLARYADSDGFDLDFERSVWPYRDWVIRALNDDMPFDQFTIEQLAGDLLPDANEQQLIATGFHRNTALNREQGIDITQWWYATLVDRVNTTGAVWLGVTVGCAQCHDHKYDPFTQRDYYRLLAVFNQDAAELEPETINGDGSHRRDISPKLNTASPLQPDDTKANTLVMKLAASPRDTFVHVRGNYLTPGDPVAPGVPMLPTTKSNQNVDRLALARWLMSDENPLAARVAVNRIWQQHFGVGLVETLDDFGSQGAPPSHPELLDWLACEFREHGWSVKHLHRLIVTSATYRQRSETNRETLRIDPRNRWLSHFPRRRLTAEQLRDNALAIGGVLVERLGGPPVFPYQPADAKSSIVSSTWRVSNGSDRHRRAIYTCWKRTSPYASFLTFDAPGRQTCAALRMPTNTPLQALDLLNDPVYFEAAAGLAAKMLAAEPATVAARLSLGMRSCTARAPSSSELEVLEAFYRQTLAEFEADSTSVQSLLKSTDTRTSANATPAEQAAYVLVANALLNLDETISKP